MRETPISFDPSSSDLSPDAIEELAVSDCWAYLNTESFGRLGVTGRDGVDIFPVNYLTHQSTILFRSAPGTKLVDVTESPAVAFEIDGTDQGRRWSVVVRGHARRLGSDSEIHATAINELQTEAPTAKWNYVRIEPTVITGRRFIGGDDQDRTGVISLED